MTTKNALSGVEASLGPKVLEKIQCSKLLLVGAGGIGCELLKNLALSGFRHVDVIDLDTIDVSNLNRQLLFRSNHVGMPKCTVACQVATDMVADPSKVKYIPHHGNVCDNEKFNVQFVEQFDLVLNALDNVTARRRVNRLCLAASVPLIEAGTTGYLGQVNVIDKESNIACYECRPQETQKVYPICTIRSTPSMPVHTVVWAKEFYKLLFGEKVEESMLYEDPAGEEPSTYMQAVLDFRDLFAAKQGEEENKSTMLLQAAEKLVDKFYRDEIQKQLDMERYKTARKTPVPLASEIINDGASSKRTPPTQRSTYRHTDIWSKEDCIAEFASCLIEADPTTVLPAFDKDDTLSMNFVTATSNLRSYVFGIEPIQSFYSAKGIAGNIIPAIATTNAIAAGLQILQSFHILKKQLETGSKAGGLAECCSYSNIERFRTRNGLYTTSAKLEKPNPACFVCRKANVPLTLNVHKWSLQDFLNEIIKKDLGFEEPTIMLEGDCIWEEGQDADVESFKPNLVKLLPALPAGGIQHGTVVTVEDFSQDLEVEVTVTHQDVWEKTEEDDEDDNDDRKYVVGGTKPQAAAVKSNGNAPPIENGGDKIANGNKSTATGTASTAKDDDDDDDSVLEVFDAPSNSDEAKRPLDENGDNNNGPPTKKHKMPPKTNGEEVEVIEID